MTVILKLKNGKEVNLTKLIPGTGGGSLTDYATEVPQIIHWFPFSDGSVALHVSGENESISRGLIRETNVLGARLFKRLKVGREYELPITTRFGEGVLVFTV